MDRRTYSTVHRKVPDVVLARRAPLWPAALVYKNALPPLCSVDAAPARRDTLSLILSPGPPSRPTRPTRPPSCTRLFATD